MMYCAKYLKFEKSCDFSDFMQKSRHQGPSEKFVCLPKADKVSITLSILLLNNPKNDKTSFMLHSLCVLVQQIDGERGTSYRCNNMLNFTCSASTSVTAQFVLYSALFEIHAAHKYPHSSSLG